MQKYETDTFDDDTMQAYEAHIAALERLVGRQALELEFLRGSSATGTTAEKRPYARD
ncbi:hypothetical protein [Methylobacterium sp. J-068]|uniref:hypothetical protein n=1 Tax=Methylobacterium sp. J-068 TaxID=2836649 RepID=UPI001FBA9246|nr:hypothetical protein [Methylobacterium sp. J-068]MCJ2035533.1 hypothetical protein [Methylobacterium sp. J-068]